jgi:acyl transferase domain-containing protein
MYVLSSVLFESADISKMYLGLDRAHFLSPSGQCKAFDASADGYCRGEGCGAFVIKKVSDAIADGDRIHAIIKAVEINQSGNTHSITHPHVPTQEDLFKHVFRKTRIDPHMVSPVTCFWKAPVY